MIMCEYERAQFSGVSAVLGRLSLQYLVRSKCGAPDEADTQRLISINKARGLPACLVPLTVCIGGVMCMILP
jgi:hypothetical protein